MDTSRRRDRTVLLVVGLLLTTGAALALLAGVGAFGSRFPDELLFDNAVGEFFADNGSWLWPAIAAAGVLLAGLAVGWLRAQLRTTGVGTLELEPAAPQGRTDLAGRAVLDAVTGEIEGYRGVSKARGRLTEVRGVARLDLRVELEERADPAALRARIERDAVSRVRAALETDDLPVRLDLAVTGRSTSRVV